MCARRRRCSRGSRTRGRLWGRSGSRSRMAAGRSRASGNAARTTNVRPSATNSTATTARSVRVVSVTTTGPSSISSDSDPEPGIVRRVGDVDERSTGAAPIARCRRIHPAPAARRRDRSGGRRAASRPLGWGLARALIASLLSTSVTSLDRYIPHVLAVIVVTAMLALTLIGAWAGSPPWSMAST